MKELIFFRPNLTKQSPNLLVSNHIRHYRISLCLLCVLSSKVKCKIMQLCNELEQIRPKFSKHYNSIFRRKKGLKKILKMLNYQIFCLKTLYKKNFEKKRIFEFFTKKRVNFRIQGPEGRVTENISQLHFFGQNRNTKVKSRGLEEIYLGYPKALQTPQKTRKTTSNPLLIRELQLCNEFPYISKKSL